MKVSLQFYISSYICFSFNYYIVINVFIYLCRVDNVDQASQAKAEIEQKQRNEAEVRKDHNDVWIPRVIKRKYNMYFK